MTKGSENGSSALDHSREPTPAEISLQLRQLELVDRIIGLEAQVARLSIVGPAAAGPRAEIERLQGELAAVYNSRTWRVGTAVLRPALVVRRVTRG